MQSVFHWIVTNPLLAIAGGAFACGVALFYLVMRRTMKRRQIHG